MLGVCSSPCINHFTSKPDVISFWRCMLALCDVQCDGKSKEPV